MPDPIIAIHAQTAAPARPAAKPSAAVKDDPLWDVAVAFESTFLTEMLNHAGASTPLQSGGGGFGEEVFRGLLSREWADGLARDGGVGLAADIYRSIKSQGGGDV